MQRLKIKAARVFTFMATYRSKSWSFKKNKNNASLGIYIHNISDK